jgi:transcriptional regulator
LATAKLELLVLRTLALAPLHGYGIAQRIEQVSGGVFKVTLGALYPALQRLERSGLIKGDWSTTENGRRARYYALTATGRRRLTIDQAAWERTAAAMLRILHADSE